MPRVAGHSLMEAGHGWVDAEDRFAANPDTPGEARCRCGARSDPLPTAKDRRAWYVTHRDASPRVPRGLFAPIEQAALGRLCETCGARPGDPCHVRGQRKWTPVFHTARLVGP